MLTVEKFLLFFDEHKTPTVVQVGANDGEQNDPLRPFLKTSFNGKAILIEPLPYYFNKVSKLYVNEQNIHVVLGACGENFGEIEIFFISPVADQMNGDGSINNWAHGQGSTSRAIVENWIDKNSFRGDAYVKNISFYKSSLSKVNVKSSSVSDICDKLNTKKIVLLIIDTLGFESQVLRGIAFENPTKYIIYEFDLKRSTEFCEILLKKHNYVLVSDREDKIWRVNKSIAHPSE